MTDDEELAAVFRALSDPNRRALLDSLAEEDGQTTSRLETRLPGLTRFGVMRHLRVLEGAGLVTTRRVGREKHHYLNPVPIRALHDRWISRFAAPVVGAMVALKGQLEEPHTMGEPQHVYSIVIKTTAEELWHAITDGDETVRYYYGTRVASDWEPGSGLTYRYPDGSLAADGEVLEVDRPHRLAMRFHARWDAAIEAEGPVHMVWQIDPAGEGTCRLTVTTDGYAAGSRVEQDFTGGVVFIVSGLKTLLETGRPLSVG
ncbi:MAG: ArsR/SmtB family transcription factor [Candidatus Limnocylindrales bacterium]